MILAQESPGTRQLVRGGEPVWPVRNRAERAALEHLVRSLGGRVEFTTQAVDGVLSGPELVVGLGTGAAEDAQLYAHLTRRSVELVASLDELATVSAPAVVVTTFDYVGETLFDLLYGRDPLEIAPGVVFSFPGDDLRRQVLARSASLRCAPGHRDRRRVDLQPLIDFGRVGTPDYTLLGSRASPSAYRDALARGAALLTLSTHSDGIDSQLVPDLTLCPMDKVEAGWDLGSAPSCMLTGICHRQRRPVDVALADGSLFFPDQVAADVFVNAVCWGAYPAPGVQSPRWSLTRRLLEGFSVGAVLTTWEIVSQTPITTAALFHDIATGTPLGRALATHLSSPDAARRGHQLALFGDPAMRLAPQALADPLAAPVRRAVDASPGSGGDGADFPSGDAGTGQPATVELLLSMVDHARASTPTEPAGRTTEADPYPARPGAFNTPALWRQAIADHFARYHTDLSKYWLPRTVDVHVLPDRGTCRTCGRRTVSRVYHLDNPALEHRRHTHCPQCGPVEDVARGRDFTIEVDRDGTVRLHGWRPAGDWSARIVLEPQLAHLRRSAEWPADAAGKMAPLYRMPGVWPPVPLRVAVLAFWGDGEFAAAGCLTRVAS